MTASSPLSLYIHIPFCTLKCSYCDFNSYAGIESLMRPFVDALCEEMRLWSPLMAGRPIETIFFGGGTPSLLPIEEVQRIMATLRDAFRLSSTGHSQLTTHKSQLETSFEANPGTIDRDYLCGLLAAGVNRISFGVQSFHDDELAALDRIHSAEEAKEACRWAREAGFERINLDLIYGLPEQPLGRWQATLEQAIELAPEHLSLYALTIEEGTKLAHDIERGQAPAPDGDIQAEMYEWSQERLASAGYQQYEISNWCRPGEECRHNLVYWRNGEWLGLGPGAHSHLRSSEPEARNQGWRFADVYSPKRYIELVEETLDAGGTSAVRPDGSPLREMRQIAFVEEQTAEMEMADTAILGLRLNEGLDVGEFESRFGRTLDHVYGPVLTETESFGLLERENGRVRLTEHGRLLANEVFVRLLPDVGA
jgi:oxygen-independent coproporphyrinogen-3 oxidase